MPAQTRKVSVPRPPKTALLVANAIVEEIARDSLKIGDRLPAEREMLQQYGVGRGTLRESLRFLELQGVIAVRPGPGGGPVVQHPDASNLATVLTLLLQFAGSRFRTIAETRVGLEPLMASLAAERITKESIEELQTTVTEMEKGIDDLDRFLDANKRFHDIIAWASGNALYGLLVDAVLEIMDGTVVGVDYPVHRRPAIAKAHREILDALSARDSEAAEKAMRAHIREYMVYTETKFGHVLDEPVTWTLALSNRN